MYVEPYFPWHLDSRTPWSTYELQSGFKKNSRREIAKKMSRRCTLAQWLREQVPFFFVLPFFAVAGLCLVKNIKFQGWNDGYKYPLNRWCNSCLSNDHSWAVIVITSPDGTNEERALADKTSRVYQFAGRVCQWKVQHFKWSSNLIAFGCDAFWKH